MKAERAAEELKVIRQLMERPIRVSTMSGLSAILAGLAALAGCWADAAVCATWPPEEAFWINLPVWAGVFALALLATVLLTRLRERRQNMPFWSRIKTRILLTILPPFVAGVGLTLVITGRWYAGIGPNQGGLIPAVWMLCYGLALWQLGGFSPREVRILGAAFILAGLVAAAAGQLSPYWSLGLTFGGFHIVYGIVVWIRHGG